MLLTLKRQQQEDSFEKEECDNYHGGDIRADRGNYFFQNIVYLCFICDLGLRFVLTC